MVEKDINRLEDDALEKVSGGARNKAQAKGQAMARATARSHASSGGGEVCGSCGSDNVVSYSGGQIICNDCGCVKRITI